MRHKSLKTVFILDQGQDRCAVHLRTPMTVQKPDRKNKEAQLSSESRSEVLTPIFFLLFLKNII